MNAVPANPASEDFWAIARDLMRWLRAAVSGGEPRRILLGWLTPLETLLRKLLLIEAAALPAPRKRETPPNAAHGARLPPPRQRSATRRVWFRITRLALCTTAPETPAPAAARAEKHPSSGFGGVLLRRIAAAADVLADPAPHARRLAARLRRAGCHAKTLAIVIARAFVSPASFSDRQPLADVTETALSAAYTVDTG